ncbi:MAG: glycosyltransferase family 4 protein [Phycisphaerales bacterium]|nr:MAG: glycosyltransferase family 4 protein [Phycisphaerales bacterium]
MLDGLLNRVAFVGNYLPRRCGIATFTTDLCEAVSAEANCLVVPVNDRPEGYDYPPIVRFTIDQHDLSTYHRAAQFININNVDTVSLQHEFGIFGGAAGGHILALLEQLRTPVVTTVHTVLRDPLPEFRKVFEQLMQMSDRVIVMSHRGQEFLRDVYGVPEEKTDFIPHGIPDFPFFDPSFYKDQFDAAGKRVLLTFGLLHRNKGLEHAIRALPPIVERVPNVLYFIVGATHPGTLREEGEAYRLELQRLARDLGIEEYVVFHNRFVETRELIEFMGVADAYMTPYLMEDQITSGTLAWAVGAGKAVISTPYWYAQELLAEDRGVQVPFESHEAIAEAAISLLTDDARFNTMRKQAYLYGRDMTWANVGRAYLESFAKAHAQRAAAPRPTLTLMSRKRQREELPLMRLRHLRRLTDETGILQHALFSVPDYDKGYSTDDNARALILMVHLEELGEATEIDIEDMAIRYLSFLLYAFNPGAGRFRNCLTHEQRRWLEDVGSEDSHGRALWALGEVAGRSEYAGAQELAGQLFSKALPAALELSSPRGWAFTLLGIHRYLQWFTGDRDALKARDELTDRLVKLYGQIRRDDWRWFEDSLTYSNARLPHALLVTGDALRNDDMIHMALESLEWLAQTQHPDGNHFVPIGTNGFYRRGGDRARFDQQPVEAHATVSACLKAFRTTGEEKWYQQAERAFEWFLGRNDLGLPLIDARTGACHDGLHPDRVNANQGAESTLSYLMSLAEMRLARQTVLPTRSETRHAEEPRPA